MNKSTIYPFLMIAVISLGLGNASAHFQAIIPSDDMVGQKENRNLSVRIIFFHPFEGDYMSMEKPEHFWVISKGGKTSLLPSLQRKMVGEYATWKIDYKLKQPGDHIFYVVPKPYWEPAEECFIVHYTKVVVNAFGMEDAWDTEIGLKTEIVPLTRPYGLWSGNVFQGVVKVNGKPVPYSEVEVEYYNKGAKMKAQADPMITQVIKADENGVFTYAMPKAGWWAFAALNEDEKKMKHKGKEYPVEIGAVIWVKTHEMK